MMRQSEQGSISEVSPSSYNFYFITNQLGQDQTPFSKYLARQPDQSPFLPKQVRINSEDVLRPALMKSLDIRNRVLQMISIQNLIIRPILEYLDSSASNRPRETKYVKNQISPQIIQLNLPYPKGNLLFQNISVIFRFQYFNSPNLAITVKKPTYTSPKIENIYNELQTEQRIKYSPWNIDKLRSTIIAHDQIDEDDLMCSEEDDFEEHKQRISPNQSFQNKSENSLSISESRRNKKFQHINFITLRKKEQYSEQKQKQKRRLTFESTYKKNKRNGQDEVAKQEPIKNIICNCKRSKCLKLYCDCFAAGQICGKDCNCIGCSNNDTDNQERQNCIKQILDRNPNAFREKVEPMNWEEDLNLRHFKGCNCKKSNCLKKYCECYQIGVKCSELCKCEECKNCTSGSHSIEQIQQILKGRHSKLRNENIFSFSHQRNKRIRQY